MEALRAWLAAWIRKHRDELIEDDHRWAMLVGAPTGWTLSGYSYKLELAGKPWGGFWRPKIDWGARVIFGQIDHCKKAYIRESTKEG